MVAFFISFFDAFYYSDLKIYVLIFRSVILVTINYRFWCRVYFLFISANEKKCSTSPTHTRVKNSMFLPTYQRQCVNLILQLFIIRLIKIPIKRHVDLQRYYKHIEYYKLHFLPIRRSCSLQK